MHLDSVSDRPMFQQIADGLRQAVAAGVYRAGESVPSVRAQAQALRINPNTVQRAYEELQRDGVLEARAGLGLFVAAGAATAARASTAASVREAIAGALAMGRRAGLSPGELDRAIAQAQRDAASLVPRAHRREDTKTGPDSNTDGSRGGTR